MNGIPHAGIRGCITEVKIDHLFDAESGVQCGRENIDPLRRRIPADDDESFLCHASCAF
jgi:hypothetical protein